MEVSEAIYWTEIANLGSVFREQLAQKLRQENEVAPTSKQRLLKDTYNIPKEKLERFRTLDAKLIERLRTEGERAGTFEVSEEASATMREEIAQLFVDLPTSVFVSCVVNNKHKCCNGELLKGSYFRHMAAAVNKDDNSESDEIDAFLDFGLLRSALQYNFQANNTKNFTGQSNRTRSPGAGRLSPDLNRQYITGPDNNSEGAATKPYYGFNAGSGEVSQLTEQQYL